MIVLSCLTKQYIIIDTEVAIVCYALFSKKLVAAVLQAG